MLEMTKTIFSLLSRLAVGLKGTFLGLKGAYSTPTIVQRLPPNYSLFERLSRVHGGYGILIF